MSSSFNFKNAAVSVLVSAAPALGWGVPLPILYVDAASTGPAHNGMTWCTAFLNLNSALAVAGPGTIIRVADGRYTPPPPGGDPRNATYTLVSAATIEGGYAGCGAPDPNQRDPIAHPTRLSGDLNGDDLPGLINITDNCRHVLTATNLHAATTLDGVTIEGGNSDNDCGGAMTATAANLRIANCVFRANSALCGGAIYLLTGSPTLVRCRFEDNQAQTGGAVACANDAGLAAPLVAQCLFRRNTATGFSGGAWHNEENANSTLVNCIFAGNSANRGGAISGGDSDILRLVHCTIVGNVATIQAGGLLQGLSNWTIENCLLWQNSDPSGAGQSAQLDHFPTPPAVTIHHTTLQGWTGSLGGVANDGLDPRFVDAIGQDITYGTDDDNMHLRPESPAIDTGDPAFTIVNPNAATDIDGQPRILACRTDRGADEYFTGQPHTGDFSGNGSVGPEDVPGMVTALLTPSPLAACVGDLNSNGITDGRDIPPFIDALLP